MLISCRFIPLVTGGEWIKFPWGPFFCFFLYPLFFCLGFAFLTTQTPFNTPSSLHEFSLPLIFYLVWGWSQVPPVMNAKTTTCFLNIHTLHKFTHMLIHWLFWLRGFLGKRRNSISLALHSLYFLSLCRCRACTNTQKKKKKVEIGNEGRYSCFIHFYFFTIFHPT